MWKHKLVSIFQWNVCCCYNSLVSTSIIFDGQNIIKTHLLILPDFTEVPFELKSCWSLSDRLAELKLKPKWTFLDDRSGSVQWVQPAGLGLLLLLLLPGLHQAEADWEGEGLVGRAAPPPAARPEQQGGRRLHLQRSLQGGQVWEGCYQGLAGEYLQGWRPSYYYTYY